MVAAKERQVGVRFSEAVYAELTRGADEGGVSVAAFTRAIVERALRQAAVPPLAPAGVPRVAALDWSPMQAELAETEGRLGEVLEEILRAVHEHGYRAQFSREAGRGGKQQHVSVDQAARDEAERDLRRWKRSVGR